MSEELRDSQCIGLMNDTGNLLRKYIGENGENYAQVIDIIKDIVDHAKGFWDKNAGTLSQK